MDAKSKANFINSVASRQKIPCPVCNELNEFDSRYCYMCGAQLINASANPTNDEVTSQKLTTTLEDVAKTYETEIKSESNINSAEKKDNTSTAFEPIKETQMVNDNIEEKRSIKNTASKASKPAFDVFSVAATEEPEEVSVFAQGLPSWDLVPPQIVVRRKKK